VLFVGFFFFFALTFCVVFRSFSFSHIVNISLAQKISSEQMEYQKNVNLSMSSLSNELVECRDAVTMLESLTSELDTTTTKTNNDVLDLWNLASQTSLDLQTSERKRKSADIRRLQYNMCSTKKITSSSTNKKASSLSTTGPVNYTTTKVHYVTGAGTRAESVPLSTLPQRPSLYAPKPTLDAGARHEIWKKRSMLTNPSSHVFVRRDYAQERPKSAAAASNRRSRVGFRRRRRDNSTDVRCEGDT